MLQIYICCFQLSIALKNNLFLVIFPRKLSDILIVLLLGTLFKINIKIQGPSVSRILNK